MPSAILSPHLPAKLAQVAPSCMMGQCQGRRKQDPLCHLPLGNPVPTGPFCFCASLPQASTQCQGALIK